jgi:Fe-S cluster assembly iron-binding protein IscA
MKHINSDATADLHLRFLLNQKNISLRLSILPEVCSALTHRLQLVHTWNFTGAIRLLVSDISIPCDVHE